MNKTQQGSNGVARTKSWLAAQGLASVPTSYVHPFDLTVNGWRCEVKTASMNAKGRWDVNIHRHGKMTEQHVDFYIFVLEHVPFTKANLYIVIPSPLNVKTLSFSFRSILMHYASYVGNVTPLMTKGKHPMSFPVTVQQGPKEGTDIYRDSSAYRKNLTKTSGRNASA